MSLYLASYPCFSGEEPGYKAILSFLLCHMYFDTTPGLADQGGTVGGELPSTLSRMTMYASLETSSSIIVHRSMKCP